MDRREHGRMPNGSLTLGHVRVSENLDAKVGHPDPACILRTFIVK
jgi:hypothetical protein